MRKLRPLLVFGTRPEAIKMAPVVHECLRRGATVEPIVCTTGQHREMLTHVVEYFGLPVDEHLDVMQQDQTLSQLTARCIETIHRVLVDWRPDCLVAQGDTTTVMVASLVAFYHRLPFVHVEAGLRTWNLLAPWPEELNRRIAGLTATLHCAPTQLAAENLIREGVTQKRIRVTGNTVVDALINTLERERASEQAYRGKYTMLDGKRIVLITGHRRESFGPGFENICRAICTLAGRYPDCQFVYPVHLNPRVREPVCRILGDRANVRLLPPVAYPEFVWLMDRSSLILTDSGGVQEEAIALGRPMLVMRASTERPECVELGAAKLVGTSATAIVVEAERLLTRSAKKIATRPEESVYGDGNAAERIVDWILEQGWDSD